MPRFLQRWSEDDARHALFTGLSVLAFLVLVGVVYPAPMPIVALGVIVGSLSGLVAIGLVLIYRANRVVNFAQGSLGGMAAVLAASLIVGPKWPYFPAVLAGLLAAIVVGAMIEVLIIRRFARSPRLVLTVATIGVAQLLDVATLGLPKLFNYNTVPQPPEPFKLHVSWFPVVFNGGHVVILIVVPLATAALVIFFRRSRVGIAVRAAAESTDRAAMLGIPVRRINTLVWTLAAGLSAVGVLLRLPIQGVAIGAVLGPSLLLQALAAAVIGRMEHLGRTLIAALVLGVVEQAVFFRTGNTDVANGVLLAVILIALLVNRTGDADRAAERDASSWAAVGLVRPLPRILRRLPEIRIARVAVPAAIGVFLLAVPLSWTASRVSLFTVGLIFAILILSLVVLTGWTGQISLAQMAFAAIGGCVAGSMAQTGKDFFIAVAAAGLVGMMVAVAIGIPALRIKGPFMAVTTLAFAVATGSYFVNEAHFPWLVPDRSQPIPRPIILGKFDLSSEWSMYYVVLAALVFCMAVVWRMRTSRTGRVMLAVRDNTRAAQSYGVSPVRAQLTAFAVSGFMAAVAGALYAYQQTRLTQTILDPESSIKLFAVGVVGGLATVPGALLGAAYQTWVNYSSFTRQQISALLASGIGVLGILLFLPGGLGGAVYSLRDRCLRWIAKRRGLHVPSLLADSLEDDFVPTAVADVAVSPGATVLLRVDGVEVSYGKAQVLFGVDFHVEDGEILALLGTNGAGKSTILSAICGLVDTGRGRVTFDGRDITGITPQGALAAGIVLIPGGKAIFPTLTVAEHLRLAGWVHEKSDPAHVAAATERALSIFPVLAERLDQRAGNLSGGEQQMLALAQSLIAKPRVLLIDELSLGLAPLVVGQLLAIVREINAAGTAIVLVEQSVNVAASLAHRAVFLEKGMVRFSGPIDDLMGRGDVLRAVFLGGAELNRTARQFVAVCDACGHEHPVALEVSELAVSFGGIRAVDGVSFQVRQGEVMGLIGPNGAGKTTVLDMISGYLAPTRGRVVLAGEDVTGIPPEFRATRGLGRSFQDARLFSTLTVREAIAVALDRHTPVPDALAAFVLSPMVRVSEAEIDEQVDVLIDLMRLGAFADKFVGELSTGSRRIVDLACVLAHRPSVLLLDEPSSGIAQREAEALGPVLLDVRDQTGTAILVIEHDMPLVAAISDELIALEAGVEIARGLPADVLRDARVVAGYLGGSEAAIARSGRSANGRRRKRVETPA
ncbi:MAG: ATP-binding cassette domain-containing protein [Acidimicrobiales bacterium]